MNSFFRFVRWKEATEDFLNKKLKTPLSLMIFFSISTDFSIENP